MKSFSQRKRFFWVSGIRKTLRLLRIKSIRNFIQRIILCKPKIQNLTYRRKFKRSYCLKKLSIRIHIIHRLPLNAGFSAVNLNIALAFTTRSYQEKWKDTECSECLQNSNHPFQILPSKQRSFYHYPIICLYTEDSSLPFYQGQNSA